ncbi:MAG: phage replication initiation protein, NGO0469 family [Planctomycetota bacterium]
MGLTAKDKGGGEDFDATPEGLHDGICIGVWDVGTHYSEQFGKSSHKCFIMFELIEQRIQMERDGKIVDLPRAIGKMLTVSLHRKATLRHLLESWRGKSFTPKELDGFDLKRILGVPGQIQVIHNRVDDKTWANINAIMPYTKPGKPKPENPLRFFSLEDGFDIPPNTPEFIVKMIEESSEWNQEPSAEPPEGPGFAPDESEDIPF